MTGLELILAWISIAVPICGAVAWGASVLNKKFDKIEKKFDDRCDKLESKIDDRCDKLESQIGSIKIGIEKLNNRMAHIEGAYFGKDLPKHVAIGED